jgi:cytochrome c-type biogenesis protein CcmH
MSARSLTPLAAIVLTVCAVATAAENSIAAKSTPAPRTSLPAIERQVMCVTCKIPLNVAQSQQADRERAYIQDLIDQGEDEAEVKRALVAQYGPTVLGLPSAHGFEETVYVVPLAVLLALLGVLVLLLPRWRRSARDQVAAKTPTATLDRSDVARLESDLAQFD